MKGVQAPKIAVTTPMTSPAFSPTAIACSRLLRHQAADVAGNRVSDRAIHRPE